MKQNLLKTLKKSPDIKKRKCKASLFKGWEKRHVHLFFFLLPSSRLMFIFLLYYKKSIGKLQKNPQILYYGKFHELHLPFLTHCSAQKLRLVFAPRALPSPAPVACLESAVQIPFPFNTSKLPTLIPLSYAGPRLTLKELRARANRAEFKFVFCWELFIGRIM